MQISTCLLDCAFSNVFNISHSVRTDSALFVQLTFNAKSSLLWESFTEKTAPPPPDPSKIGFLKSWFGKFVMDFGSVTTLITC